MNKKEKNDKMPERFVGFQDLATLTGMSIAWLRKAQYQCGLPHYKIGNRVRFRISEVEEWFQERRIAG